MAFRPQDLCKTTRRSTGDELPRLFPRVLGDDRLFPRLGIAIRFFETHLGRPRRELDIEALMALFGDAKLTRCLLHCLARTYRYHTRPLADILGAERAAALATRGLAVPSDLRALAYSRANQDGGFVRPEARTAFLDGLLDGLEAVELERALWLDTPDEAILVRHGPIPSAADLRTCYNVQVLETLLCTASESSFALRGDRQRLAAVAARYAVPATVQAGTVTLYGRPDAVGSWIRHGVRVARTALTLLAAGVLGPGIATVQLGQQRYEVRLDAALLRQALPPRYWSAPEATWTAVDTVVCAIQSLRRQRRLAGWHVRWWSEPLIAEQGLLWPDLTLRRGAVSIGLLLLPAAQVTADADALAVLAERLSCVILAHPRAPHDLPAGLTVLSSNDDNLPARLAAHLERHSVGAGNGGLCGRLTSLMDVARAAGSLAESELARRLDCDAETVSMRLAPAAASASDLVYIDGFGLCSAAWLAHARRLMSEEAAHNRGRLELGRLGRRLRELTGHNEGLHALIAHLSGELQPVA